MPDGGVNCLSLIQRLSTPDMKVHRHESCRMDILLLLLFAVVAVVVAVSPFHPPKTFTF